MVLHFAVAIFAPFVRGHAETTNGSALGGVAQLGIATEISYQNNFVEGHEEPFFSSKFWTGRDTTSEETKNQANQNFYVINLQRRAKAHGHWQNCCYRIR
jgi:hypothetical protein